MAKQKIKYILIPLTVIVAFLSWLSISKAIASFGPTVWIAPIALFSSFFILVYLDAILIKEKYILAVLLLFCLFLSFPFAIDMWHIIAIFLGFLSLYIGTCRIRRDLDLNIKINLNKTIYTGRYFIILGVALIISSQYYFTIRGGEYQNVIPLIQNSKTLDTITSKILVMVNPDFKNIADKNITVDDFIIETQKKQLQDDNLFPSSQDQINKTIEEQGSGLTAEQKDAIRKDAESKLNTMNAQMLESNNQAVLAESRKSLSQAVGKELTGQEKISEIFPEMINKKITDYFRPEVNNNSSLPLLPIFLAIILFLTILPVGSLLNVLWVLITQLIFWILVKTKVVTVLKVQKEVDVIE